MNNLPKVQAVSTEHVVRFIQLNKLYGKGCGGIDSALLACAAISGAKLWTLDKRLSALAETLDVVYVP